MEYNYTIENLPNLFLEHAKMNDEHNKQILEHYKQNFPDSEVPSYISNPFNISQALHVMTAEILKMKYNCA